MKKFFILTIIAILLLSSLSSCNKKEDKDDIIRVGMELKWPPFEMANTDGKAEGISVLIAEEFGAYLGKDVEIVDMAFSSLIPALETEKIDVIIASMGITEDRKQKINFSEPYMYFKLIPAVNKKSGIKDIKTLFSKEGVRFVAPKSFSSIGLVKEKANNPKVIEFDDKATASLELANFNADAFIVDAVTAVGISRTYPDDVEVIYEPAQVSPVAMGMRKNDSELLKKANEFVAKMEELGVNDKIREQYDDVLKEKIGKGYEFYINED